MIVREATRALTDMVKLLSIESQAMEQACEQFQQDLEVTKKKHDDLKKSYEELEKERDTLRKNAEELVEDNNRLRVEIKELKVILDNSNRESNRLRKELRKREEACQYSEPDSSPE